MIMTVEELRNYITTDETDPGLDLKLQALERMIQGYTNNNFLKFAVNGVIQYPPDIKLGVIELIKYDFAMQDKRGIASESISRHSVSYTDPNAGENAMGYPKAMLGFLKPYMRARFGQGVGV